ncbi:hypothetical protein BG015_000158 [Linnemannia schmuckeri]|uniref:Uncharacterized protein n=1 Tax=Linnemannia schmuckeri TaxID=64567 RepID=A0A9P5VDT1_9FUNG|nr:hypothetical protein BG015_000158 [Linnemannia schmuckeri]
MNDFQQQQERQTDVANTGERRPLLARTIERTVSWTTSRLEADQVDIDIQEALTKKEEEEEAQWFRELRRRPWRQRPSAYWLVPWSALSGVVTGLCTTTMWDIRSRTICENFLRNNPTIHAYSEALDLQFEAANQLAPLDECMTPTMIGMVRQLESRIVTISSVSLLLTLAKWCSLSDVYGRKLLFHIGLAGTAIYICLNWFAASRYNILGYYVYYLEAVSFTLIPAAAVLNPAIFAYCGKIDELWDGVNGDNNLIVSMTSLVFHWDVGDNERYQTFTSLVMTVVLLGLLPLWNAAYKAFVVDDTDDSMQPAAAHHDWIQHSPQPAPARPLFDLEAIKMELFFSICSLFFVVVGYLLIPLFPSPTMLYFAGGLTTMGAISAVSVISLLSSVVPNQLD